MDFNKICKIAEMFGQTGVGHLGTNYYVQVMTPLVDLYFWDDDSCYCILEDVYETQKAKILT